MLDLEKLIQDSVRDRNKTATLIYQAIKAEKQKAVSAKNAKPYDDIAEIAIIRKLVNQHKDSIEQYRQANRPDLVASEQAELDILQTFLPPKVQPETLQKALTSWCKEQEYEKLTQKEMGIAIKALKAQYPSVDGKLIADVVKKSLTIQFMGNKQVAIDAALYERLVCLGIIDPTNTRNGNVGQSNYAKHLIQPWAIWMDWDLNPWDADIVKRTLRSKGDSPEELKASRILDYNKIIHICRERLRQLDAAVPTLN